MPIKFNDFMMDFMATPPMFKSVAYTDELSRVQKRGSLSKLKLQRGIVFMDSNHIEFGYFPITTPTDFIWYNDDRVTIMTSALDSKACYFDNEAGIYVFRGYKELSSSERGFIKSPFTNTLCSIKKGCGKFPYAFMRHYEARELFNVFDSMEKDTGNKHFLLSEFMKYTFGLEFETSMGYIPQSLCFKYGLIPLRDGSISGLEYSTVVLDGDKGLDLLEKQVNAMNFYTTFNKECSLHVHMGGFPVEPQKIFALYKVLIRLQPELEAILPPLTFRTSEYKKTGKDYCKIYTSDFRDFEHLFAYLTNSRYLGSLTMPHPADVERQRKWQIETRYHWVNLINMVCYQGCKTVEFRFLRPSFNFRFIYMWLWIFNAILKFAENTPIDTIIRKSVDLRTVLSVYPENIREMVLQEINIYTDAVRNQVTNDDYCGAQYTFVDNAFAAPSPLI